MKLKHYLYLALPLTLLVPAVGAATPDAPAPTYTEINTSANVNMGYGGVKWTLGDSLVPELVAGYRYASVTNSGATQGGDLSISVKITGKTQLNNLIHLGKLRAKYLNGIDYLQGEVGGGWDFAKNGPFAGVGAQGPYVNAGVDYDFTGVNSFSKSFSPYAGFNSIGIYNRPHASAVNAATGCTPWPLQDQYIAAYAAIPPTDNFTEFAAWRLLGQQYANTRTPTTCDIQMGGKVPSST